MEWIRAIDNMGFMSQSIKVREHLPIDNKRRISVQASTFHKCHRKDNAPKHKDSIMHYDSFEVQLHGVSKEELDSFKNIIDLEKYQESADRPNLYYYVPVKIVDKLITYLYTL